MSKYQIYIDNLRKKIPSLPDKISHVSDEQIDQMIGNSNDSISITDLIIELLVSEAEINKYDAKKLIKIMKEGIQQTSEELQQFKERIRQIEEERRQFYELQILEELRDSKNENH